MCWIRGWLGGCATSHRSVAGSKRAAQHGTPSRRHWPTSKARPSSSKLRLCPLHIKAPAPTKTTSGGPAETGAGAGSAAIGSASGAGDGDVGGGASSCTGAGPQERSSSAGKGVFMRPMMRSAYDEHK